ncbi:phosphate acetyltransferase [Sulfurimonas sp.]|uniref:phosphate acetyltransferase n=1 Tax=Sulfurimonas sp. TaxID=2022749 RepID=UPI002B486B05|nr:phosphate acetyltransferase [Sulfurimonas sp.]
MNVKSLYISAQEKGAGTLFISMGMMEILKRNLHNVAFFRPIIYSKSKLDRDIEFILKRYNIDMNYKEAYGFDIEYVEAMLASNRYNELINQLITKFKKLEKKYDFVLCEGIRRSFLSKTINYDLNIKIAQNFGSSIINIISAKDRKVTEIYEDILMENENVSSEGCLNFATFVNRLDKKNYKNLEKKLKKVSQNVYLFRELDELDRLTVQDVLEGLDAKAINFGNKDHTKVIKSVKVAALSVNNFLEHLEEDDLIVVPADRSDIILGLFGALYSKNYPNISAIVLPYSTKVDKSIQKLIDGFDDFNIPILSVSTDTYQTANNISKINARLRVTSERKIALALGLFHQNVNIEQIEKNIVTASSDIMTPMMFEYKLFELARVNKKSIVLPESKDERILRAAEIILRRGVAEIILLGDEEELRENYLRLGLDLSEAKIINHLDSKLMKIFVDEFYNRRKAKGLSEKAAEDAMLHVNYFATMMVELGYADGMVSGAVHSTGETIRPALQIIKTVPNINLVSSVFFMCLKTKVLVYGDCAINQDPNAKELAQIAQSCAATAQTFGIDAKVAMLSYSTGDSGYGVDVDKVREATKFFKKNNPKILIEGPIQYDAAVNKKVASSKLPNSKVAGNANVLIFTDLNAGNNTYKAVQRSSDAVAIGPILQGLNKPINDLSRGCDVYDIVNTIAITAVQAGKK